MKTDLELQLALAKMLPEKLIIRQDYLVPDGDSLEKFPVVYWKNPTDKHHQRPRDTEWLHVCWLIEQELTDIESQKLKEVVYAMHEAKVRFAYSASWQQRATALIAVKGEK